MAACPARWLLFRGPASSDAVCLTFDDGPHPEHTPPLLDVLKDLQVPATFFVVGQQAEKHPEIVQRMVAEGHAVGHHSLTHSPSAQTSARLLSNEVGQSIRLLKR